MRHANFDDLLWYCKDPTMVILCGVPGSGKSTLAKKFKELKVWDIHNADSCRKEMYGKEEIQGDPKAVFFLFFQKLDKSFNARRNVIIDNTNCKPQARNELALKAKGAGYKVQYWVLDTPLQTCLKRNAERERKVPKAVIETMHKNLHDTMPDSKNNIVIVLNDDDDFMFLVDI